MDEGEADQSVRVERALLGLVADRVRGDQVGLNEDQQHDRRGQHEVDPQEDPSHARELTTSAG